MAPFLLRSARRVAEHEGVTLGCQLTGCRVPSPNPVLLFWEIRVWRCGRSGAGSSSCVSDTAAPWQKLAEGTG